MIPTLSAAPLWFLVWLVAALLATVGVMGRVFYDMFRRDAEKRDALFEELFELNRGHETRLAHLEGAHRANHREQP
jgi:hypothetical protein